MHSVIPYTEALQSGNNEDLLKSLDTCSKQIKVRRRCTSVNKTIQSVSDQGIEYVNEISNLIHKNTCIIGYEKLPYIFWDAKT